jgi:hypothetical protein
LRDLRTAKQSIQDQQKQIRGQYSRRHARNRKHQGFPRFVVTSEAWRDETEGGNEKVVPLVPLRGGRKDAA